MNAADRMGYLILKLSETLQKETALLRIKAAISKEHSELILSKYEEVEI